MLDTDPRPASGDADAQDLYGVTAGQVATLREALDRHDIEAVEALIVGLHTADLADLIEALLPAERQFLIEIAGPRLDPELLTFLAESVRDEIVGYLGTADVAAAVTELETDDAVDAVSSLDDPVQAEVLGQMAEDDRAALEEALALPEDSAGRLMEREFVCVPANWTVGDTIDFLREEADRGGEHLPENFYDIFVIDRDRHPVGIVSLSRILRTQPPVRLDALMDPDISTVPVGADQEDVANMFRQYDLASAPVIDEEGRIVGVITHDDVMDVIHEEAEEDILLLAGVKEDNIYNATLKTSRARISWLSISLVSAFAAAFVIWFFKATVEQIVVLAILMPIVSALGGNAGTQTMTVAVRAIAMKDLNRDNAMRVISKEVMVAALNGVALSLCVAMIAGFWFDSVGIGVIIAAALIITMLAAGVAGVIIPLALNRMGADPAVASGVFVITVTDVVGLFAFLGFGALFLV